MEAGNQGVHGQRIERNVENCQEQPTVLNTSDCTHVSKLPKATEKTISKEGEKEIIHRVAQSQNIDSVAANS